jgi:hypothetical protein
MEKHGQSMPDRVHCRDECVRVRLELDRSHGGAADTERRCSGQYSMVELSLRAHAASTAHRDVDALLG